MWWGRAEPTQEAPEFFSQVDDSFCTAYLKERWKTHLTRSIENQLDYAHLPYVHRKTIGRFATSVQTLPEMILDQQQIKWFFSESEGKSATSYIEFRFPNLWINRISETYGITLVFVPVDDQTTDLYLQNHRKFLNIPGLNRLIDFFMVLLNRRILNEDQRVVLSQTPRDVREAQDEVLFPSDRAIQHFRKWVDAGGSI
jgi:phenylpropionate dioxygenase-like ring-hydroxylating dioxygenase large terminal subunit